MTLADVVGKSVQVQLLFLPNDILTAIIEYLVGQDRTNLALSHNRLRAVEEKSGCRRFISIVFSMNADHNIRADTLSETYGNKEIFPGCHINSSFRHATTDMLRITGELDSKTEGKLRMLLKTLTFHSLDYEITSEQSCRLFEEVVRNRKGIKKMSIQTNFSNSIVEDKRLRQMILSLPAAEEYYITPSKIVWYNQTVLDDKVLDHLISSSVNCSFNFCRRPTITAEGLAKAFEAIRSDEKKERYYSLPVSHNVVVRFLVQLDRVAHTSELRGDTNTVEHRTSGATCKFEHARVVGNDNNVYFVRLNYTPKHQWH